MSLSDMVPPSDMDAEAMVLAAAMLQPGALDDADMLRPEHFYADANRRLWEAAQDLAATGKPTDPVSLAGWLRDRNRLQQIGGMPYIAQLVEGIPVTAKVAEYARRIIDKWRLRRVIEESRAITAEAYLATGDVGSFIQAAESRIFAVAQDIAKSVTIHGVEDVMRECVTETAALRRGDKPRGASTGFLSLDKRIGGLRGSRVYACAGRPGMGKTSFLTKVARTVARSQSDARGVFIASIEMPAKQIGDRMIAQEAQLDTRIVETGLMNPGQWQKYVDATSDIARLPIIFEERGGLTLSELRSSLRRAVRKLQDKHGAKLGLIGIDFLQLMGTHDLGRNLDTNTALERLTTGITAIAKELDVPVVMLSQLNRECEKRPDKRPIMADLRGSGGIEQAAHTIIFFHRDDMYRAPGDAKDDTAEFIIGKCRGGRTGTVKLGYLDYCTEFVDEPDDDPNDEFAKMANELGDFAMDGGGGGWMPDTLDADF
jgi:replicative DNA helicase